MLRCVRPGFLRPDRDRLSSLILAHGRRYRQKILAALQQHNRLLQTLAEREERSIKLLHNLRSMHEMEYHRGRELATDRIVPPEESSISSRRQGPPATSA